MALQYLQYAKQNRQEWADKGKEIVAEMVESFKIAPRKPEPKPKIEPIAAEQGQYPPAVGMLLEV
jgi:hypothetical protein